MKVVVLVLLCIANAFAFANVPNTCEIDSAFTFGDTNRECYTNVYPYLSQVFDCDDGDAPEGVRAQYCIMTNVVSRTLQINGDHYNNFGPKIQMMTWVCGFSALRRDPNAICYCADYIGSVQQVSTNAYVQELRDAILSNGVSSCRARWSAIFSYNNRIAGFRNSLVEEFSPMAWTYVRTLDESEKGAFVTNLYQRARMSSSEIESFTASAEFAD